MKLHYLQHVPFEGLGSIETWASAKKFQITHTALWQSPVFPSEKEIDLLVVMGGPMNVDEEKIYPWLAAEKKFIEKTLKAGKKVLGVCLGAQLIARVLGAPVYKNKHKEIGWLPVTFTPEAKTSPMFSGLPEKMTVFHWHGDTFDLPSGAVRVASSEACLNQAFSVEDQAVALQFHLESTPESVRLLAENCADELVDASYIQSGEAIVSEKSHYTGIAFALSRILSSWF